MSQKGLLTPGNTGRGPSHSELTCEAANHSIAVRHYVGENSDEAFLYYIIAFDLVGGDETLIARAVANAQHVDSEETVNKAKTIAQWMNQIDFIVAGYETGKAPSVADLDQIGTV